jgi:hypothetical protein
MAIEGAEVPIVSLTSRRPRLYLHKLRTPRILGPMASRPFVKGMCHSSDPKYTLVHELGVSLSISTRIRRLPISLYCPQAFTAAKNFRSSPVAMANEDIDKESG